MGWEYHERARDMDGRFMNQGKTARVQFRVTEQQHAAIRARATARSMDVTAYLIDLVQRDMIQAEYGIETPKKKPVYGWRDGRYVKISDAAD